MAIDPSSLAAPPQHALGNVVSFIQLSIAPVFLLTGVGAMLNVLTSRLGRIIDRARALQEHYERCDDAAKQARLHDDLRLLSLRARLISWAISFSTSASLCVALIIVTLFVQSLFDMYVRGVVPVLFIIAMMAFVTGLLLFLREIYLATAALRIGPPDDESA